MKISFLPLVILLFIFSCKNSNTTNSSAVIGKYSKEPLPNNFEYKILEDRSNDALEKNQLIIEINKKLTVGQIATLAEKLYSSKKKQRRFYIMYYLPKMNVGAAWAISNFDPQLDIQIIGSTEEEERKSKNVNTQIDGEIIGQWYENQYSSASYILYIKNNTTFLYSLYKDGSSSNNEILKTKVGKTYRLDQKPTNQHGEYYIISESGDLEFYNKEDVMFTSAPKITGD